MEKERVNHYTKRLWNANHITEIRSILKEFEFECVSKNASMSDEALHIGDVGESFSNYLSEELKKYEGMKVGFNRKK